MRDLRSGLISAIIAACVSLYVVRAAPAHYVPVYLPPTSQGQYQLTEGGTDNGAYTGSDGIYLCPSPLLTFCNPITGTITTNVASPTAALIFSANGSGSTSIFAIGTGYSATIPQLKVTSADATGCPSSGSGSTNAFVAFVSTGPPGITIRCDGLLILKSAGMTAAGPIVQTGNGNSITYGSHNISNANCGSAASGQTTGSTCNGDMGYVLSSAAPAASITLGTPYTAGNATCEAWDNSAPTVRVGVTNSPTTTVAITSPTNAHVYFWHCFAFNGG
jgi:hypothetical protein